VAALDHEPAHAWRFRPPADTPVIVRQVIGLVALSVSAIVPLWTARAVLGLIVRLFLERRIKGEQLPFQLGPLQRMRLQPEAPSALAEHVGRVDPGCPPRG
jgi:hypothetical protein